MKWICIELFFILFLLSGCQEQQIDVSIPAASSEELGVRSAQYTRIMKSHSFEESGSIQSSSPKVKIEAASTELYAPQMPTNFIPQSVDQEKRMALVIGNANYINGGKLANPLNDADAISRTLKTMGFRVKEYKDVSLVEMKKAIDIFGKSITNNDVSLFFYAGHGIQVKGNNYLIPVDASINSENDVEYNCVHAGRILTKMEDAGCKTNIIILDACRDNPFQRSWSRGVKSGGSGLAFMDAPSGSIIAYSTSPGSTAADGRAGGNGVYSGALLKHMQTPNISIEDMFKRVRVTVEKQTHDQQTPWESTSLKGNFYFKIQK